VQVSVQQGTAYSACDVTTPLSVLCDRGASASGGRLSPKKSPLDFKDHIEILLIFQHLIGNPY
jgi:hypothetical protein